MKIKNIITVLLVTVILASCAPAATPVLPTETAIPSTSTVTPIPPTPTITPTPAPENLADAKDLSKWIDNYVHAFGGKVTVHDVEMDASQLTDEIRKNAEGFTQVKEIYGVDYLFLLINNIPLAMREGKGQWEELTSRKIIELNTKPDDSLKYISAQFSNPFEINQSAAVDDVLGKEFNAAYLNDGSWHVVEQIPNRPDYSYVVDAADDAQKQDMKFVMSAPLLDSGGDFAYVSSLKGKYDIDPQTLSDKVKAHINEEMAALNGKIDAVIVANEIRPKGQTWPDGTPEDPYTGILGEEYVDMAFQIARDATKDFNRPVKLIFNDGFNFQAVNGFSNGSNNTRQTLEIINRLKPKGLLDGVGLQMHIRAWEKPNIPEMIRTIQQYGVPVYVTEFEIDVSNIPGTAAEREQVRLKLRKEVFEAFLKSGVVVSISHWTALDDDNGNKGQLFDSNLAPTADLFVERQVLFEYFLGKQP